MEPALLPFFQMNARWKRGDRLFSGVAPVSNPLRTRGPARFVGAISALGLVALVSACGGQPEATNADEAAIENIATVANEAAENEVATSEANVTEAADTVAPAPANSAEAPAVKAEAPAAAPVAAEPAPAKPEAPAVTASAGDAANGAKLFAQCKICHSVEPGKNGLGPSLHDINGRKAAVVEGFSYSPALKNSNITWTDAALSDYLRAPMKLVPGTKMAFAGMAKDSDRADVIAYLDTLK
jgi:cytochrome c2